MNQRNAIEWILGEVEGLVASGVIPPECGEALRRHYGERLAGTDTTGRTVVLSVIGAALIGAGVILLVAHNWDALGRPARTVLSMLPLLVSGALSIFAAWRRSGSVAWRESTGVAQSAGVAASIALVSQTYHVVGDLGDFLFTWLILILPLPYLLRAICPALIYLGGIAVWAGCRASAAGVSGGAPGYWLFLAALVPFFVSVVRENRLGRSTAWLASVGVISAAFGLGFSDPDGAWIPAFAGFSGVVYLAGALGFPERRYHPVRLLGAAGIAGLTFALAFKPLWSDLHLRWPGIFTAGGAAALALPCVAFALESWPFRNKADFNRVAAAFPVLTAVVFIFCQDPSRALFAVLVMNFYGFLLALATAFRGLRERAALTLNAGLILFAALLLARFMDSEFGILERAVAFIFSGALILGANLWMLRGKGAAR